MAGFDISDFLRYGKVTDYPVPYQESKYHFSDITLRKQLPKKLMQSEIFNVFCIHPKCLDRCRVTPFCPASSRFKERISYEHWVHDHHTIHHPNSPQFFQIASFWSTIFEGCAYHTEYRLISLQDNKPLKPLKQIYARNKSATPKKMLCGYCHANNKSLRRCGGCKILFYCSKECQKKHWFVIHKTQCKKWKKKYKNKTLTEQQIEDLCTESVLKLSKLHERYHGKELELFKEMLHERARVSQKDRKKELLFDSDDKELTLMNTMMDLVISAFDVDEDKKLNFREWSHMLKELGFGHFIKLRNLWNLINEEMELMPTYDASLNTGIYGSYIYPEFKGFHEIFHGPQEIMETLRWCAWLRSNRMKDNDDEDFEEEYGFNDHQKAMKKAFLLLIKLSGHAQQIVSLGEAAEETVYEAILEAVPYLNIDIASIIYNYTTLTGQHIIYVSWHKIKWLNLTEDQEGLWSLYDRRRDNQYYDLFYLSKGYEDTTIGVEICDDRAKCDKKLDRLKSRNMFAFTAVDMQERMHAKQRWCLGQCGSYIPNNAFHWKEYAMLIGKVLEFHGLNPKLCHYIYIGVGVKGDAKDKTKIVDAFNAKYGANTRYRPHNEKKPMLFNHDMLNFD